MQQIGSLVKRPPRLTPVRVLEDFDGPLLTELRDQRGATYIEKWCSRDEKRHRTLVVRSDQRTVAEFLSGRLPMRAMLVFRSSGIGFLRDYEHGRLVETRLVEVGTLPSNYLPQAGARHDPSPGPFGTALESEHA